MNETFYHTPVMLGEVMDELRVRENGIYFDGTLGGGGHSLAIMKAGGRVIATDLDKDAIAYAGSRFEREGMGGRYTLVRDNFKNFTEIVDRLGIGAIDGAILDLGVSSRQLDDGARGFSYRYDAELDMRMDDRAALTAEDIVNEWPAEKLTELLYKYGEESFAHRIVSAIERERGKHRIKTTGELASIISSTVPYRKGGHPAKKTFQALRIQVNDELSGLGEAAEAIARRLVKGGRLCVLTFHSLEDRIIKNTFRLLSTDCICDKSIPICVCGHKAETKLLKAVRASGKELSENNRSHSATLRAVEKL